MGHFGDPGETVGSTLVFLGSSWDDFGDPWELFGLILELLGCIFGCHELPKLTQSGLEWIFG